MQNTVIHTENKCCGKGRVLGWLGTLKDFPEKQDPGMWLLRGKKERKRKKRNCLTSQKNKRGKKKKEKVKNLSQREWHSCLSLWPTGTEQPVLPPPPPQKKQGRLKENKPHFLSKPVYKRLCFFPPKQRASGRGPFLLSPLHLSIEPQRGSVSSLTSRGSLLVQFPVVCPPQISSI